MDRNRPAHPPHGRAGTRIRSIGVTISAVHRPAGVLLHRTLSQRTIVVPRELAHGARHDRAIPVVASCAYQVIVDRHAERPGSDGPGWGRPRSARRSVRELLP